MSPDYFEPFQPGTTASTKRSTEFSITHPSSTYWPERFAQRLATTRRKGFSSCCKALYISNSIQFMCSVPQPFLKDALAPSSQPGYLLTSVIHLEVWSPQLQESLICGPHHLSIGPGSKLEKWRPQRAALGTLGGTLS